MIDTSYGALLMSTTYISSKTQFAIKYPCVGCGYCCKKSPCHISNFKRYWDHKTGRCSKLLWDQEQKRYICLEVRNNQKSAEELAVGYGCCSNMNTWRNEVKERP